MSNGVISSRRLRLKLELQKGPNDVCGKQSLKYYNKYVILKSKEKYIYDN